MRPVQFFSDEYLDQCRRMKPADVLRFLDEFRRLYAPAQRIAFNVTGHPALSRLYAPARRTDGRLVSLEVPEDLPEAFKAGARLHDVRYQTRIRPGSNG